MNWVVALVAIVAAADVPQRVAMLRSYPTSQRIVVAAGLLAVTFATAAAASSLLDALDISAPTMQVGAAIVAGLWSAIALVTWSSYEAPEAVAGGLLPGLFPVVLTPPLWLLCIAVAGRNGIAAPLTGAAIAAAVLAAPALAPTVSGVIGTRAARMISASAGIATGTAIVVDGVFAV